MLTTSVNIIFLLFCPHHGTVVCAMASPIQPTSSFSVSLSGWPYYRQDRARAEDRECGVEWPNVVVDRRPSHPKQICVIVNCVFKALTAFNYNHVTSFRPDGTPAWGRKELTSNDLDELIPILDRRMRGVLILFRTEISHVDF